MMHSGVIQSTPFQAGTTLFRYQLEECIGIGGMGWVFRAIDTALEDHHIALKIFYPHLVRSIDSHLFEAEVLTSRRLSHPHIVQVYNYHRLSEDLAIMSMELVQGSTLEEHVQQEPAQSSLDLPYTVAGIAAGLAYAHRCGVLHRDIKPENILLNETLEPKVADFGIAQLLADSENGSTQKLAGTPAYMSPEQFAGGLLHPTSDVYSFGCLVYFLLHRAPPFQSSSFFELATRHLQEPLPIEEDLLAAQPPWLSELLQRCTEKEPEQRFATMDKTLEFIEEQSGFYFPREDTAPSLTFSKDIETPRILPEVEEEARPRLRWIFYMHIFVLVSCPIAMLLSDNVGFRAAFILTSLHFAGLFCRKRLQRLNSLVLTLVCFGTLAYYNPWSAEKAMIALLHFEQRSGIDLRWVKEQLGTPVVLKEPVSMYDLEMDSGQLRIMLGAPIDKTVVGSRGENLIHKIPLTLNLDYLRDLQSHGVDINGQDMQGRTPLRYAIDDQHIFKMAVLIKGGADLELPDYQGVTPLAAALDVPQMIILERLLCAGAMPTGSMGKKKNISYLQYTIQIQDAERVACLLRRGAQLSTAEHSFEELLSVAEAMNPAGRNYRAIRDLLVAAQRTAETTDSSYLEKALKQHKLLHACDCDY